jgi:hypothetical protein
VPRTTPLWERDMRERREEKDVVVVQGEGGK